MIERILEVARALADGRLDVYSVERHPSGAYAVFTSEGKKYLEDAEGAGDAELTVRVGVMLGLEEPVTSATEQEKPAAKTKAKAAKAPKAEEAK